MAVAPKKLPKVSINKAPVKNAGKAVKNVSSTKAPVVNTGKALKGVSSGKSGGSKKVTSKATSAKKDAGAKTVPV